MESQEIHQLFLKTVIEAVSKGATAEQLSQYLKSAADGMKINAAFRLKGDALLTSLNAESTK